MRWKRKPMIFHTRYSFYAVSPVGPRPGCGTERTLEGGFGDFQAKFKASEAYPNYEHYILKESQDDPKLVENYDPKVWKAGYF